MPIPSCIIDLYLKLNYVYYTLYIICVCVAIWLCIAVSVKFDVQ